MAIYGIDSNTNVTDARTENNYTSQVLDTNFFLEILMTEMSNQNPFSESDGGGSNSMSSSTSTLALYTMIEQLEELNQASTSGNNLQTLGSMSSMIGKYALIQQDDGTLISGEIDSVTMISGTPLMVIGEDMYTMDYLLKVDDEPIDVTKS